MIRMVSDAGRVLRVSAAFLVFASPVSGQSVLLQIRPHVGDTLRVRLQQEVAMTSFPVGCGNSASAFQSRPKNRPASCAAIRADTIRTEIFSRAVVRRATRDATEILAITDSVRSSWGANHETLQKSRMKGPVEMRISSDGSVELGAGPASDDVRTMFGQMPATLSRKSVSVGEKWMHEMRLPLIDEPGGTGRVRSTLRLDSLNRSGEIAFISVRGVLSHGHSDGSPSETSGLLTGSMQLNRRLAWITDTYATIDVWTVVKNAASAQTMDVHTRVVQSLKVSGPR
jgi:hypothetical protein